MGTKRSFGVQRIEDEPLPPLARSALRARPIEATSAPAEALVHVFLAPDVLETLLRTRAFSRDVEEGGFLFGRAHRDADAPERWIVVITEALRAEHVSGSREELVFSAESFAAARRLASEREPRVEILGWYHTHLAAEGEDEGLSVVDRDLHFTTFRRPWQVAALVNVDPARDPEGRRVSVHARRGDFLVRCAVEVLA
jgi:proteasome lid subunit RPN8/RPN11